MTDTRPHLVLDLDSIRENNTPYGDLGTGFHLNETERAAAIAWYESLAWGGGESITSGVEGSLGGTPIGGRITMGTNQSLWLSDIEGVESWDENIQIVFFSNDHLETIYDVIISLPTNQVMTYSGILRITTNAAREDTENYGFDLILDDDLVRTGVQRKPNANWQKLDEDVLPTLSTKTEVNASQAAQDALIDASWKQVNLEPFFNLEIDSEHFVDADDSRGVTQLNDGWVHLESSQDEAAEVFYNVVPNSRIIPGKQYTLVYEFANVTGSASATVPAKPIIGAYKAQLGRAQGESNINTSDDSVFYRKFNTTNGDSSTWQSMFVAANCYIKSSINSSCDVRLSLYEGSYDGPYIPYTDSPDDIKTRVADLESSQASHEAKAELEHMKLMVASQADNEDYASNEVHQTAHMEFPVVDFNVRYRNNWKIYDLKDIVAIAKCYIDTSGTALFNRSHLLLDGTIRSDPFADYESAFAECDSILNSAGITGNVIGLQIDPNKVLSPLYVTDNPAYFTEIMNSTGTGITRYTTRVYNENWQQLDVYMLKDNIVTPVTQPISSSRNHLAYRRMTTYLLPSGTQEPLISEPESFAYRVDGVNKIAYDANGNVVCRYVGEMVLTDVSVAVGSPDYLNFKHDRGFPISESGESEIWPVNDTDFLEAYIYHVGENGNLQQGQRIAAIEPEIAKLASVVRVIQFDANGGTGDMASIGLFVGASATVPENAFTPPTDRQFGYWDTKPDGTGTTYNPGDTLTPTENITLYAQWTPVS